MKTSHNTHTDTNRNGCDVKQYAVQFVVLTCVGCVQPTVCVINVSCARSEDHFYSSSLWISTFFILSGENRIGMHFRDAGSHLSNLVSVNSIQIYKRVCVCVLSFHHNIMYMCVYTHVPFSCSAWKCLRHSVLEKKYILRQMRWSAEHVIVLSDRLLVKRRGKAERLKG
jgi:hypothetical protein